MSPESISEVRELLFNLERKIKPLEWDNSRNQINEFKKKINRRKNYENKIMTLGRKAKIAHNFLLFLFSNPVVTINQTSDFLKIGFAAATRLINDFQKLGLLKEITGFSRNRMFAISDYLAIFK